MLELLQDTSIAIIGGGRFCRTFLHFLIAEELGFRRPTILGVADRNEQAEGMVFAREKGIFTTTDYRDLFRLQGLEVLIELTNSNRLAEVIRRQMPEGVRLIDHIDIRSVWSILQIRREKVKTLRDITGRKYDAERLYAHFEQFSERIEQIVLERTRRYQEIEREFIENRRAISQIVDGSTIPTFVIDANHVVTHWNKACERLTGYPAGKVVGTDEPWRAFRSGRRPLMADLILDGVGEEEVLPFRRPYSQVAPLTLSPQPLQLRFLARTFFGLKLLLCRPNSLWLSQAALHLRSFKKTRTHSFGPCQRHCAHQRRADGPSGVYSQRFEHRQLDISPSKRLLTIFMATINRSSSSALLSPRGPSCTPHHPQRTTIGRSIYYLTYEHCRRVDTL